MARRRGVGDDGDGRRDGDGHRATASHRDGDRRRDGDVTAMTSIDGRDSNGDGRCDSDGNGRRNGDGDGEAMKLMYGAMATATAMDGVMAT